tara:strand:- start:22472 stop:22702 length:231 start_codon:yes stop_codon:yes gene_type:complete
MGAIPLHRGVHAVGKVVDEQGQPMRDVMVGIEDLGLFVGSEADANAGLYVRCQAQKHHIRLPLQFAPEARAASRPS